MISNSRIATYFVVLLAVLAGGYLIQRGFGRAPARVGGSATPALSIQSSAFGDSEPIPPQYTCDGANVNPPLSFGNVPAGAQSLALVVTDSDAPTGTWVHWTVWNINPRTAEIREHSLPLGAVEGVGSSNKVGYSGPCPPFGLHHYRFTLYALSTVPNVPGGAPLAELANVIAGHTVEQATLVGLYTHQATPK